MLLQQSPVFYILGEYDGETQVVVEGLKNEFQAANIVIPSGDRQKLVKDKSLYVGKFESNCERVALFEEDISFTHRY